MSLNQQVQQILETLTLRNEKGRLELMTPVQTDGSWFGRIGDFFYQKRLSHTLAPHLETYLAARKGEPRYDRLCEAFQDMHCIRINGVPVQRSSLGQYSLMAEIGMYALFASSLGIIVPENPALSHRLLFGLLCTVYGIQAAKRTLVGTESIEAPLPSLDEIGEDLLVALGSYRAAKEKYLRHAPVREFRCRAEDIEKPEIQEQLLTYLLQQPVYDNYSELMRREGDECIIRAPVFEKFSYSPALIDSFKRIADPYLQPYCPTLDLTDGMTMTLIKGLDESTGGYCLRWPWGKPMIILSETGLQQSPKRFFGWYVHEVAHADGLKTEGRAQCQAIQVLLDMAKDYTKDGFDYQARKFILEAVAHSYVRARKRKERGWYEPAAHLGDALRSALGKKCTLDDEIFDELSEVGVPQIITDTVKERESYEPRRLGLFMVQTLFKNDTFLGGYTVDFYRLLKQKKLL
ncbi:hypothetical protein HY639_00160 [Candidatus Woesearchaeota archaeon]|nr:hypothetical protein [Candidatus Woesearchaeota archaeon]